jgi:serine/threonine protein kinase
MTPEEIKSRTAELFHEALTRTPDQQSAFLAVACRGDEELFQKVKQLLQAYEDVRTSGVASTPGQGPILPMPDSDALLGLSGRYVDIELIGRGGMGVVFRARDREIDKVVALKMLYPVLAHDERVIERFRNEIRLALDITHKNVCRTYGLDRVNGTILISMEYVEGETLRSTLDRIKGVSVQQGLVWSQEICEALAAAHDKKIVHRDLKPENIMIDRQGHVKVMDFGIARSLEAGEGASGTIIGTPQYMSPEQAMGRAIEPTSDIYSLGLVLYELFTGTKRDSEHPVAPREVNPYIPSHIDSAISSCLAEKPKDRPQAVRDVAAAMVDLPQKREDYRKPLWAARQGSRHGILTAAVLLAALLIVIGLALNYWRPAKTPHAGDATKSAPVSSAPGIEPPATASRGTPRVAEGLNPAPVKVPPVTTTQSGVRASVDGAWSATFSDAKGSAAMQFNLFQNSEGHVAGTYTTSVGGGGSVTGRVKNDVLTFELTQSLNNCPGIFKGTAKLAEGKGAGTYTGADCLGDRGKGTFTMSKGLQTLFEQEKLRKSLGGYLRSKLGIWTAEDAQNVINAPTAHRFDYDNFHSVVGDIYSYLDPTLQMLKVELSFDSNTKRLKEAYLYPNRMTWDQCKQLWGEDVEISTNPDGTKLHVYKDPIRIRVNLDKDSNVISLVLY